MKLSGDRAPSFPPNVPLNSQLVRHLREVRLRLQVPALESGVIIKLLGV